MWVLHTAKRLKVQNREKLATTKSDILKMTFYVTKKKLSRVMRHARLFFVFITNFSTWIFLLSSWRGNYSERVCLLRFLFYLLLKYSFCINIHKKIFSFSRKLAPLVDFIVTQINDLARVKNAILAARIKAHKLIKVNC